MTRTRRLSIGQNLRFHTTVAITRAQKARNLCFHFRNKSFMAQEAIHGKMFARISYLRGLFLINPGLKSPRVRVQSINT